MKTIGRDFGDAARKVYATASGTLPNGKPTVVNTNGTVSAISSTANPQAIGDPTTWQTTADQENMTVVFDSGQEKFVVLYQDAGNQGKITAKVGTVSGTTVSFGNSTAFSNAFAAGPLSAGYDSTSGKIIVAYRDGGNSDYGTAAVGTVSGTGISFGTPVVFNSAATGQQAVAHDTANNCI